MDNTNFLIGEFRPLCKVGEHTESGTRAGSGSWLGHEFAKSIGGKPYPVQTVIDGIMDHQRILSKK